MTAKSSTRRDSAAGGTVVDPNRGKDWVIAELAERQHGVVSRTQLLAAGIGPGAIEVRIRSARLHPVHRGVYRVGHTAPLEGAREMAAVLACGRGALISHRSAGGLWLMLAVSAALDVELTIPRSRSVHRPGIRVYRFQNVDHRDVRSWNGIPITSPARTLLDLAAVLPIDELERAFGEGRVRRLLTPAEVRSQIERHPRRSGVPALRELLDRGPAITRSEAERRMLALIREAELPRPQTNVRIGGYEVDFLWPAHRVIVEVDGYAAHSGRPTFERDRIRDGKLQALGYVVLRITWLQLSERPHAVVGRVAQALASRLL
jgi:very-short-patch-repair endonuclease